MSDHSDASSTEMDNPRDEARLDGLDDLVRPRLSQRSRLVRGSLLVALVLVVVVGLVWRSQSVGADTPSNDFTDSVSILVTSNLGGGVITVNGQKQTGTLPLIVQLHPGRNSVTLAASPFEQVPCIVIWPEATTSVDTPECGTTALSAAERAIVGGKSLAVAGQITFDVSGSSLSSAECARALAAISHSLESLTLSTAVPAGQHIATGNVSQQQVPFTRSAPTGLSAHLTPRVEDYGGRGCDRLYANNALPVEQDLMRSGNLWNVIVPVIESLTFVDADGKQIAPPGVVEGTLQMNLIPPSPRNPDWQLASVTPPLPAQVAANLCGGGTQVLASVYHLAFPGANGYSLSDLSPYSVEGCLVELTASADNWETRATYLWRFGVLLATDAASHHLLPMLPMASAAELAAAQAGA